jgi:hypothetical protein
VERVPRRRRLLLLLLLLLCGATITGIRAGSMNYWLQF